MAVKQKVLVPHNGRPAVYPWARWMKGHIVTAVRGKHFKIDAKNFDRIVRKHAQKEGVKVVTERRGDTVRFQFSK